MGSGISVTNKQAVEILKNEIKTCVIRKKSFTRAEKEKYEELMEFFRNHDKNKDCNNEHLIPYRNWLIDCEYDRLIKKIM